MKNIKKIILVNIIVIFAIFTVLELISKNIEEKELLKAYQWQFQNFKDVDKLKINYKPVKNFDYNKIVMSKVKNKVYKGNKKGAIVTIGCSNTAGEGLQENQTFAYKLNKYTGRTTYNRGVSASGPQLVYRQLIDKDFKKQIPDAEYIIYVFLSGDHILRQFLYSLMCVDTNNNIVPRYTLKNNELKEVNPIWYKMFFFSLTRKIINIKTKYEYEKEENEGYPLFFKTMEECVKVTQTKYPNSKFVLLEVTHPRNSESTETETCFTKEQIAYLKKLGIIYINVEELVGHDFNDIKKYRIVEDGDHPNERYWDEIVPALSKKLNL